MTATEFATKLEAKSAGAGWIARCPAHEDQRASLSIASGDDGKVLLKCHAGCSIDAITQAANVAVIDLFPSKTRTAKPSIVATYDYRDALGKVVYQAVRFEPKDFRQRRPNGKRWIWNMDGVERVLYRLPELLGQRIAIVPEGEKDADALAALNYAATTNVGGAGKWQASYSATLHACDVRIVGIIADNDDPGRKHANDVARHCRAAGLIATVIELPDLPKGGDLSDYLATHTPAELEAIITKALASASETATNTSTSSPAPLAAVLTDVESFIRKFVVLSPEQSALMTLWIAQTHAIDAFDYVAYLNITSPLPECGKSRTLEVLEALVHRPWMTGRVTAAVLMRKVHAEHPVVLLDESDAAFKGDKEYAEALRGLLNTGFHRSGTASACVGQGANISYKDFTTFSPKAIAGIGRLPSTVESRSIPIALRRRTKTETIAKWRRRDAWPAATVVRERLAAVIVASVEALRSARPTIPEGLSDRAEDVLEPLFAIADLAGGDWPASARAAAVALMGTDARGRQEENQNIGLELLSDIKGIFADHDNPEKLTTQTILDGLKALEDRPWATFSQGDKPVTPHKLARMLKAFDVEKPRKDRAGDKTFRGYRLEAFTDAFSRYLPSKAEQAEQPNKTGPEVAKNEAEHAHGVPLQKTAVHPDKHCSVPLVPLQTRVPGEGADDASYFGA